MAIDFQFSFELANHLVEGFVHQLAALTLKYRNLHFAIPNDFILTYDELCRNDGEIYMFSGQSCTPIRKAISDSLIVLQSSSNHPYDSRDYKGRVRNFNIYYQEVGTTATTQIGSAETASLRGPTNSQNIPSSSGNHPMRTRSRAPSASCFLQVAQRSTTGRYQE